MGKQIEIQLYNGILFRSKQEPTTDWCNGLNESEKHYTEGKKAVYKNYIMHNSVYIKL